MGPIYVPTILAFLVPCMAVATTCFDTRPPSTLDEDYRAASSIVVARITSCLDRPVSEHGTCPDHRYKFDVIEVLKDSPSSGDHPVILRGSDHLGCGPLYAVGQEHLLFFNDDGHRARSSGNLDDPFRRVRRYLAILREYRDGLANDLSEPWRFLDNGVSCEVTHAYNGGLLSFVYRYSRYDGAVNLRMREKDHMPVLDSYGEPIFDPEPIMSSEDMPSWELITGPEFERRQIIFRATFHKPERIQAGSVTVDVGDQSWSLERHAVVMSGEFRWEPRIITTEVAGGAIAEEILDAISKPAEMVVAVVETSDVDAAQVGGPISYRTRSTRIAHAAQRFLACVDGTARRGRL